MLILASIIKYIPESDIDKKINVHSLMLSLHPTGYEYNMSYCQIPAGISTLINYLSRNNQNNTLIKYVLEETKV